MIKKGTVVEYIRGASTCHLPGVGSIGVVTEDQGNKWYVKVVWIIEVGHWSANTIRMLDAANIRALEPSEVTNGAYQEG